MHLVGDDDAGAIELELGPGLIDVHARIDARALSGRGFELAQLHEAWRSVLLGHAKLVLVSGEAGIGKSALIGAFQSQIDEPCRFVVGKFDQLHRGLASDALAGALGMLVNLLLTEDAQRLDSARRRLARALGRTSAVLAELVPELALLLPIDEQPTTLPAEETRNRLEHAVAQFIITIAQTLPLVVFVDDLQWCDDASARLLRVLLERARGCRLLVIGAHRPTHDDDHPLELLTRTLHATRPRLLTHVHVGPLERQVIASAVAGVLRAPIDHCDALARILARKTGGNPLYVWNMLRHVLDAGYLRFDEHARTWTVDVDALANLDVTHNVAEFLIARLSVLEPADQHLCQLAACLGHSFELADLAWLQRPRAQLREGLERLRDKHIIERVGPTRYRFEHDRVQQIAYATLDERERGDAHQRIAEQLLREREVDDIELDAELFRIVAHINLASPTQDRAQLELQRRLNLRAAQRALAGTAYEAAVEYLEHADGGDDSIWTHDLAFALALAKARATASYLTGDPARAERALQAALRHAHAVADRADLHVLYLTVLMVASRYADALALAREALQGVTVPDAAALPELESATIASLVHAEQMREPAAVAAARVLASMLPLTFLADPSMFPCVTVCAVQLALDRGPTAASSIAVAAHGILLICRDRPREAFACGQSAIALARRFSDLSQLCKAEEIFIACLAHWVAPLRDSELIAEEAYEAGIDCGDLQYAGYTRLYDIVNRFHAGRKLAGVRAACEEAAELAARTGDRVLGDVLAGTMRITEALIEGSSAQLDDDDAHLEACRSGGGQLSCCIYLVMKAEILYRRARIADCIATLERAEPLLSLAPGVITIAVHTFVRALACLRAAAELPDRREQALATALADIETLSRWAQTCPHNFHHKERLATAELHRLQGHQLAALQAYDEAIAHASRSGYVQDELLAVERYGDLCMQMGLRTQAEATQQRALGLRERWGEAHVVAAARVRHPDSPVAPRVEHTSPTILLGFSAAIQATQEIAEHLDLREVLRTFVTTAMTHSGAERAALLLHDGGDELELAESHPPPAPEDDRGMDALVPGCVVRFVARRAKPIELRRGQIAPLFDRDPYLREHCPAALICVPLIHGGVVLGVLYLENRERHGDHPFAPGTRHFLEVLGARAAVALENARLFETLSREIEQRSRVEAQLTASLAEKAMLLQELHHRVKNNLQVISSLLYLQIEQTTDAVAHQALNASRKRIRAMALAHDQLVASELATTLNLSQYVRELAEVVRETCGARAQLSFDCCDALELDVTGAVTVGLLLNELLSNAFMHAFPDSAAGHVHVSLQPGDGARAWLRVVDDGVGCDDTNTATSRLGLRLARALATQLDGTLERISGSGTTFVLNFDTAGHDGRLI